MVLIGWVLIELSFFRLFADIRWYFCIIKCSVWWWREVAILLLISLICAYFYSFRLPSVTFYFFIPSVFIINSSLITIFTNISLELLFWIVYSDLFLRWIRTQISRMNHNWRLWAFVFIWVAYFINSWSNRINFCGLNLVRCSLDNLSNRIDIVTCSLSVINFLWVSSPFVYMLIYLVCLISSCPDISQLLLKGLFEPLNLQFVFFLDLWDFLLFSK